MKCFEIRKCSQEERESCFVYSAYPNKEELEDVKCWIMNGAFQRGNRAQLEKCLACSYYQEKNKETGISQSERTNATLVAIEGAINNDRAKSMEDTLNTLLEKHRYFVILNLADVNNIYSCGLGVIIRMHKELKSREGILVVTNIQPYVNTLLESTKLTRFLNICGKESDAFETIEKTIREKKAAEEKVKISEAEAEELEKKKAQKCWEYWSNHNPKNANTCDECFRKAAQSGEPCWTVKGSVEGVSFEYVNEDCEDCEYYLLHQKSI